MRHGSSSIKHSHLRHNILRVIKHPSCARFERHEGCLYCQIKNEAALAVITATRMIAGRLCFAWHKHLRIGKCGIGA